MQSTLFKPSSTPWTPHAYQKKAVKFLLEHAASVLFLDPGLGKTSITLAAIKILKKKKMVEKVLLIAPLRVCYNVWPKELEKWDDFKDLKIQLLHGPDKAEALKADADIYVINPEGLDWLLDAKKTKTKDGKIKVEVDVRRFKAFGFDALVIDELSKFKHTNTGRFKGLKHVLPTFSRRWGLTGSPAANSIMDLFAQCYVLDQGRTLGPYVTHFRSQYFVPNPHNAYDWVLREGADEEIYKRLAPLALRMAADDYLDMPQLIENRIRIQLPENVRRVYDQLEEDLITQLDQGLVTAATAGVASMKCRQVAAGGIYLNQDVQALVKLPKSKREWVNLHTEKVDALADLVDELQGSPLLVAYDFGHDLDRIQEKLGREVPYIGGGVSPKRSKELEDLWNAGKLPVLLGHPQSIAFGLNLQEIGNHVAWHTLTWDYELFDQFIRRILRQGNKAKKVFNHLLIAEDTVDEVVFASLRRKKKGQNAFFEALKELRQRRK